MPNLFLSVGAAPSRVSTQLLGRLGGAAAVQPDGAKPDDALRDAGASSRRGAMQPHIRTQNTLRLLMLRPGLPIPGHGDVRPPNALRATVRRPPALRLSFPTMLAIFSFFSPIKS